MLMLKIIFFIANILYSKHTFEKYFIANILLKITLKHKLVHFQTDLSTFCYNGTIL